MSTKAVPTTYTPGQTLYWYPQSRSLADWSTYRIQAVEDSAPNQGRYRATLDTAFCDTAVDPDCVFLLFVGEDAPDNYDQAVQLISARSELTISDVAVFNRVQQANRVELYSGESGSVVLPTAGDYTALAVRLVIRKLHASDSLATVANANLTKTAESVSFSIDDADVTASLGIYEWFLMNDSAVGILERGEIEVLNAPAPAPAA